MKATIDIPDDLYRRVKAKSAMRGQCVREVAVRLFQTWIEEPDATTGDDATPDAVTSVPAWFGAARKYAKHVQSHDLASVRGSIGRGRAAEGLSGTPEKRAQ